MIPDFNGGLHHVSVSIDHDKNNIDIPLFASIDEVAKSFNLTSDQYMGLFIAGSGFLRSLRVEDIEKSMFTDNEEDNQCNMSMILHGVGGSGKSYVIRSLLALAESWMRQGSIITSAISGVAAANVSGHTIAFLLNCKKSFFKG